MNTQELIQLTEKISDGTATDQEIVQYNEWCNSFQTEHVWNEKELGSINEKETYLLNGIYAKIKNKKPLKLWRIVTAAAASLVLVSLYFLFTHKADFKPITFQQIAGKKIEAPSTKNRIMVLGDGTEVILYPGSKIIIADDFNEMDRKIAVHGQVFLKIAPDKNKPFTAYSKYTTTTALGTAFYVRDFENARQSSVILIEGKVRVEEPGKKDAQYLEPGTTVEIDQKTLKTVKKSIDKDELLALTEHKLYFDSANMYDVVKKMELFYGIQIDLKSCNCEFKRITGDYTQHSLVSVLNTVSYINNVKWQIINNKVVFTSIN